MSIEIFSIRIMKAVTRPCRISSRSFLHTSSACLNKQDPLASLTKPSAQQQDLDFFKAADILFSEEDPKRRKKFGWDFHLWQAFVACLPSVAVYLTAQYARHEMRRMEAEREREAPGKRKVEEKQQEEEARKLPGFQTIHARLDKLEGKISEIESRTAAQSVAALQEGKPSEEKEVEKVENKERAGTLDASTDRTSDARASESVAKETPMKKGEPVEHIKGPTKASESKAREVGLSDLPSKAESDKKGEADAKH